MGGEGSDSTVTDRNWSTTVDAFWEWFQGVHDSFGDQFENSALISELDRRVNELGDFAWEVGPGHVAPNALAISPGGDRDRLVLAREVVMRAPHVPGWEFFAGKPAKGWMPRFTVDGPDGVAVDVDADAWRYVVRHERGSRVILVEANNLPTLPTSYRRWAAEILLDSILGEELRLEAFDEVRVVDAFAASDVKSARPINRVRDDAIRS
jgi:hypothetical protein